VALDAANGDVADRARALLAGPPRRRPILAAALAALALLTMTAAGRTAHDTEHRFEQAQAAYPASR
jgi:Ser/Thr protein kinase RdoA (MazF antagonist)